MMRIQRLGAGEALTAVGVFHTAAGLAKYRHALREMAHEGLVDAVKGDHERGEAIWFLMCGASVFLTGRLARWTQMRTGTLPASTGWMLFGIGVVGSALLPRSGFWSIFRSGNPVPRGHTSRARRQAMSVEAPPGFALDKACRAASHCLCRQEL